MPSRNFGSMSIVISNPENGEGQLTDLESLAARLEMVFQTPKGSRVQRRRYGFDRRVVDKPINQSFRTRVVAAIADAFREPQNDLSDVTLKRAQISTADNGNVTVDFYVDYSGQSVSLRGISL